MLVKLYHTYAKSTVSFYYLYLLLLLLWLLLPKPFMNWRLFPHNWIFVDLFLLLLFLIMFIIMLKDSSFMLIDYNFKGNIFLYGFGFIIKGLKCGKLLNFSWKSLFSICLRTLNIQNKIIVSYSRIKEQYVCCVSVQLLLSDYYVVD